jgi:hypothetical protein
MFVAESDPGHGRLAAGMASTHPTRPGQSRQRCMTRTALLFSMASGCFDEDRYRVARALEVVIDLPQALICSGRSQRLTFTAATVTAIEPRVQAIIVTVDFCTFTAFNAVSIVTRFSLRYNSTTA